MIRTCKVFFLGVCVSVVECCSRSEGAAWVLRRLRAELGRASVPSRFVGSCSFCAFLILEDLWRSQAVSANGCSSPIGVDCRGRVHVHVANRQRVRRVDVPRVCFKGAPYSLRCGEIVAYNGAIGNYICLLPRLFASLLTGVLGDIAVASKAAIWCRLQDVVKAKFRRREVRIHVAEGSDHFNLCDLYAPCFRPFQDNV